MTAIFLTFNDLGSLIDFLADSRIEACHLDHLNLAGPAADEGEITCEFFLVATALTPQGIIATAREKVLQEVIADGKLKKFLSKGIELLNTRRKAFTSAGLKVHRGILTDSRPITLQIT